LLITTVLSYIGSLRAVRVANTFDRWALPTKWDFVENNILVSDSGGWEAVFGLGM